jgi:glycosyltransferase involved in cell wall biosynthesis
MKKDVLSKNQPVGESGPELSIIMPCLNEAATVAICVRKAAGFLKRNDIYGEVLVADNGSTDRSQKLAEKEGARVVGVKERGYGSALMGGIEAAKGKYCIMGDADDSYDFEHLENFVEKLRQGYDLVMGNRFKGGIQPGAMQFKHRYLGNPVLSGIGRLFFKSPVNDFHCGLRGFSKEASKKMNLRTTGMEFASEMVVKATLLKMKICEVPTTLSKDGRSHPSHLRSWRDGWRHLRFLLLYSPDWLFLYPGFIFAVIGLVVLAGLVSGPKKFFGVELDIHTMLFSLVAVIIGVQAIFFAFFTKVFAANEGLLPAADGLTGKIARSASLEKGLVLGGLLFFAGIVWTLRSFGFWESLAFGNINPVYGMRMVIPAAGCLILGGQIILGSFFLSVLQLNRK